MSRKTQVIIGWIITGLISAFMLFSAFMKIKGGPEMEEMLKGGKITVDGMRNIGYVEVLCVLLWLIPRTGVVGTLLLASYLGGAIHSHVSQGQSFMMPAAFCAAVWIASVLRFPELGQRLFGKAA